MPHRRIPSYRCYKPKNLGLVVIDSKQHYLGRYGSPESVAAYNRLIQEWLARGGASPAQSNPAGGPSINELRLCTLVILSWSAPQPVADDSAVAQPTTAASPASSEPQNGPGTRRHATS